MIVTKPNHWATLFGDVTLRFRTPAGRTLRALGTPHWLSFASVVATVTGSPARVVRVHA